jgi:hypothetical protein
MPITPGDIVVAQIEMEMIWSQFNQGWFAIYPHQLTHLHYTVDKLHILANVVSIATIDGTTAIYLEW